MTATCSVLADDVEELVGPRLRDWMQPYSAKWLAQTFDTSVSAAEKWKTGKLPAFKHMAAMLAYWGQSFADQVLEPVIADPRTLEQRAARIEQDMTALRKEIAHAERAQGLGGGAADQAGDQDGRRDAADRSSRASTQRGPAASARRTLGFLVVGISLGLTLAHAGNFLPMPEDEPAQPIQRRAPRTAPRRAPQIQRVRSGNRKIEV